MQPSEITLDIKNRNFWGNFLPNIFFFRDFLLGRIGGGGELGWWWLKVVETRFKKTRNFWGNLWAKIFCLSGIFFWKKFFENKSGWLMVEKKLGGFKKKKVCKMHEFHFCFLFNFRSRQHFVKCGGCVKKALLFFFFFFFSFFFNKIKLL